MAKIKLSKGGFTPIPEGTHIFKITGAEYDEDFGIVDIEMVTADGRKNNERFFLVPQDGEPNEAAHNAFRYFAEKGQGQKGSIDLDDLIG